MHYRNFWMTTLDGESCDTEMNGTNFKNHLDCMNACSRKINIL